MIITPQTDANHDVVGKHFEGPCWHCDAQKHVFYCDSYDTRIGFWMMRADCPAEHIADTDGEWRRNVSEAAIGRTFHRIHVDFDYAVSRWGQVDRKLLTVPPIKE